MQRSVLVLVKLFVKRKCRKADKKYSHTELLAIVLVLVMPKKWVENPFLAMSAESV